MSVDFNEIRSALKVISNSLGSDDYLVSFAWDGAVMRVTVCRKPGSETWRRPWVATLDSETDYAADPEAIIAELTRGAIAWFAQPAS